MMMMNVPLLAVRVVIANLIEGTPAQCIIAHAALQQAIRFIHPYISQAPTLYSERGTKHGT